MGCDTTYRGISQSFYSNILMLRGFFVEFDLKKPLNYFAIEIGASEVRATIKLAIFGNTIYPRIY